MIMVRVGCGNARAAGLETAMVYKGCSRTVESVVKPMFYYIMSLELDYG
jgi:hypothetical protein